MLYAPALEGVNLRLAAQFRADLARVMCGHIDEAAGGATMEGPSPQPSPRSSLAGRGRRRRCLPRGRSSRASMLRTSLYSLGFCSAQAVIRQGLYWILARAWPSSTASPTATLI